jgi:hypothetical protein
MWVQYVVHCCAPHHLQCVTVCRVLYVPLSFCFCYVVGAYRMSTVPLTDYMRIFQTNALGPTRRPLPPVIDLFLSSYDSDLLW